MTFAVIKPKPGIDDVIRIVRTKRFKINYSKPLNATFMCLTITKHIAFSMASIIEKNEIDLKDMCL